MTGKIFSDVAILGGGPGGYVSAIRASQNGAKVTLIEKEKLGGTCTNRGCIPTKALLDICEKIISSKQLKPYNVVVDTSKLSFDKIMKDTNDITEEISKDIERLMNKNNVEVLNGYGRLLNHNAIEVIQNDEKKLKVEATSVIIATGSSPFIPPIPGTDEDRVFTTDNILANNSIPDSLAIIGSGAVGLEWGTIYNNFGSEVTILEMMPNILPKEDKEITDYLKELLEDQNIKIITNKMVKKISNEKNKLSLELNGEENINFDMVLLATGRIPNSKNIGLEGVIDTNNGKIIVDDHMRTNIKNIYAIGDVVGKFMLAHVAMQEGLIAAENATGGNATINYNSVPRCIYTKPEMALVGLSEKEASSQREGDIETAYYPLRANGRSRTMNKTKGLIKLIYEKRYGEILGAQIISHYASELISEICLAMEVQATIEDLANTIHAHPTLSEIIREVSFRGLNKGLHI